jgi:hypothetical protein
MIGHTRNKEKILVNHTPIIKEALRRNLPLHIIIQERHDQSLLIPKKPHGPRIPTSRPPRP